MGLLLSFLWPKLLFCQVKRLLAKHTSLVKHKSEAVLLCRMCYSGPTYGASEFSLLPHKSRKVQGVTRCEVLFHLVELIGADGVQVPAFQLLLEDGDVIEIIEIARDARVIVLEHAVVLGVLQVSELGVRLFDVLLCQLRHRREPHVLSKILRHCFCFLIN